MEVKHEKDEPILTISARWSFTMIVVDIFVIYALIVHGGPLTEFSRDDTARS